MQKLNIDKRREGERVIQREIGRSEESRYDRRLHAVLLIVRGMSCYQAAGCLGQDPVTVQRWVRRFKERGLRGLREERRSGRRSRMGNAEWLKVERMLTRSPEKVGYRETVWTGRLLSEYLRKKMGVKLGLRQCQRMCGRAAGAPAGDEETGAGQRTRRRRL